MGQCITMLTSKIPQRQEVNTREQSNFNSRFFNRPSCNSRYIKIHNDPLMRSERSTEESQKVCVLCLCANVNVTFNEQVLNYSTLYKLTKTEIKTVSCYSFLVLPKHLDFLSSQANQSKSDLS